MGGNEEKEEIEDEEGDDGDDSNNRKVGMRNCGVDGFAITRCIVPTPRATIIRYPTGTAKL